MSNQNNPLLSVRFIVLADEHGELDLQPVLVCRECLAPRFPRQFTPVEDCATCIKLDQIAAPTTDIMDRAARAASSMSGSAGTT